MLDADKSTGLEEGESVGRMIQDVAKILVEDVELLAKLVVVGNVLLIRNDEAGLDEVEFAKFCRARWSARAKAARRDTTDHPRAGAR